MKEILSAIILVILIHLIIFYQFNKTIINNNNISSKINKEIQKKSNIKYVILKKKQRIVSKKTEKKILKKKENKKIVKKYKYRNISVNIVPKVKNKNNIK